MIIETIISNLESKVCSKLIGTLKTYSILQNRIQWYTILINLI